MNFEHFIALSATVDLYEQVEAVKNKKMKWSVRLSNKKLNRFIIEIMSNCYQLGFVAGLKFARGGDE